MDATITHVEYGEETTDNISGVTSIDRDGADLIVYWENLPDENRSRYEAATVEAIE